MRTNNDSEEQTRSDAGDALPAVIPPTRPARARAERLPGRRRPGRRQGRGLPGPGPGGRGQRCSPTAAGALVPWICDALLSNHSVKAYGRDLTDFLRHMQAQGVTPLEVTADHVKLYKRALLEAGMASATVARRLSVLRGPTSSWRPRGWFPGRPPRTSPRSRPPASRRTPRPRSPSCRRSPCWRRSRPTRSKGIRDLALMSVFFLTGCRVSAVTGACVGHLETDGVEHYLHVTEKRNKKRRKILLDAARPVLAYVTQRRHRGGQGGAALPADDAGRERLRAAAPGPQDALAAGQEVLPGGRASTPTGWAAAASASTRLRKTAINDAIRNGATMHEVREFAGHADIRTTEVYFVRKEEDAEVAARRIQIRLTGRKVQ